MRSARAPPREEKRPAYRRSPSRSPAYANTPWLPDEIGRHRLVAKRERLPREPVWVYVGTGVVFADNTSPTATSPVRVFAKGAAANSGLKSYKAFGEPEAARWNSFMMVGDPYRTGKELARVPVKGSKPSMSQIFVGRGVVYCLATETGTRHGFITRITAARR
ncbi:MAG TPA: hypothetical protein VFJ57_04435 [Solirubrobacterales bacterium]|nr:hypothetical protein [Solirubrobacterales bacterium]